MPYQHIPVQIVPPGEVELVCGNMFFTNYINVNIIKTGDDTEILKKDSFRRLHDVDKKVSVQGGVRYFVKGLCLILN
jgi:hypothetical protein